MCCKQLCPSSHRFHFLSLPSPCSSNIHPSSPTPPHHTCPLPPPSQLQSPSLPSHTPHLTGLGKNSGGTLTNQRRVRGHQLDQLPSNRLLLEHGTGGSTPRLVECPQCTDTGTDNGIVPMTDTWTGQRVKSESKGVFLSPSISQQLEIDTGERLYHLDQGQND